MSSLGIRFALPYKGGNGIVVNNNIISISPVGEINMGNIILNPSPSLYAIFINTKSNLNANALFIQDNQELPINGNTLEIDGGCNISIRKYYDDLPIDVLSNISINVEKITLVDNNTGGGFELKEDVAIVNKLQTIQNSVNAPVISFDEYLEGLPPAIPFNSSIIATVDGTSNVFGTNF
jgi:hypothetical protein